MIRKVTLMGFLVAAVTLTSAPAALAAFKMTSGRAKHEIFVSLRHYSDYDDDWEGVYDRGHMRGPNFTNCWQKTRTVVDCWFKLRDLESHEVWCGWGSVRMLGNSWDYSFRVRWSASQGESDYYTGQILCTNGWG